MDVFNSNVPRRNLPRLRGTALGCAYAMSEGRDGAVHKDRTTGCPEYPKRNPLLSQNRTSLEDSDTCNENTSQ